MDCQWKKLQIKAVMMGKWKVHFLHILLLFCVYSFIYFCICLFFRLFRPMQAYVVDLVLFWPNEMYYLVLHPIMFIHERFILL